MVGCKSFDPPLVKKTNFRRFSWKRVKFELQLPRSLLFIFSTNHFYVHKYLFNIRNTKIFQDSTLARNGQARRFDRILKRA